VTVGLALFCGVSLWQGEGAGGLKTAYGAEVVVLNRYPVPVGPWPDVPCGRTEVLKNFA
jgi:hypothetical protein